MIKIEEAIRIAAKAHEGQLDKTGYPYIFHPLRVMIEEIGHFLKDEWFDKDKIYAEMDLEVPGI